jgi:hypothetical protein
MPYEFKILLIMQKKTNQPKETMTNQELKKKVIEDMKKDDDLKKYVNDLESLSNESFDTLIKIMDKAYLKVKNK